jgi:DNA polymerase-3 subunit epsilon
MRFVAIDFETANPNLASICQIGVVVFENGSVSKTWQSLVDPEDYFDGMNVSIHGITEDDVKDAPTFPTLFSNLRILLEKQIVVSHTSFDRVALGRVLEKYELSGFDCTWLDSARVVRRAWPDFSDSGYGLSNITEVLGIVFRHHVAHEDARAAGEVVLRAIKDTGKNLEDWLIRANQPLSRGLIAQEGNPEGPLFGEFVVFTGALSMHRHEAAKMAADAGCSVLVGVNKSTTLLVVGDQDIKQLAGHEKSSKHRKAEALIAIGQSIRIIGESDFGKIVGLNSVSRR